jgi:hypothetical protein
VARIEEGLMGGVPLQQPGGFVEWLMEWGGVIQFFGQLIFWLGILLLLGYAVWQFKRWVNYQLGTGRSGRLRDGAVAGERVESKEVSVEEFVD